MHSRVFEISTEPIPKNSRAISLPDWFADSYEYCDYVGLQNDVDQMKSIEWLSDSHNDRQVIFKKEEIDEYMKEKYHEFKKALDEVNHITSEDFLKGDFETGYKIYRLKESYEDKCGFWFYIAGDESMHTLEDFYRKFGAGTYYIGSVWDYHF